MTQGDGANVSSCAGGRWKVGYNGIQIAGIKEDTDEARELSK